MFEIAKLFGTPRKTIVVQTRIGNNLPNEVAPKPGQRNLDAFARLLGRFTTATLRRQACGVYNCAGHVWAARRTSIYEPSAYDQIRAEDGYRILNGAEAAKVGDIAVYKGRGEEGYLHVARVLEIRRGSGQMSNLRQPWVLSKLNDSSGELFHCATDYPLGIPFYVEFWTDRP